MKCSKSTALAKFRIEFLRQHRDRAVWKVLALIFNKFASNLLSLSSESHATTSHYTKKATKVILIIIEV